MINPKRFPKDEILRAFTQSMAGDQSEPVQLVDPTIIAAQSCRFVRANTRLVKIEYRTSPRRAVVMVWVLVDLSTLHIIPLTFENWAQFAREGAQYLNLDEHSALDYARTMHHLTGVCFIEAIDDVEWFSPLMLEEREALRQKLREHPPKVVEASASSVRLEWCTLDGDELKRTRWDLVLENKSDIGNMHYAGELIPANDEPPTVILSGLPINYRPPPGTRPFIVSEQAPTDDDGWQEVGAQEAHLIIRDINRQITPLIDAKRSTMRRKRLHWYDIDLLKLETRGADTPVHEILWNKGLAVALDGTAAPFHRLNDRRRAEQNWALTSVHHALEYLIFFSNHLWGSPEAGPFEIVSTPEHRCFTEADPDSVAMAPGAELEQVKAEIAPPTIERQEDGFTCADAHVFCNSALFRVTFQIDEDALVMMTSDEPLMVCRPATRESWTPPPPPQTTSRWSRGDTYRVISGAEFTEELISRDQDLNTHRIELKNCIVWGRVSLAGVDFRKGIELHGCRFRGPVDLRSTRFKEYDFIGCSFEGGLTLQRAEDGSVTLRDTVVLAGVDDGPFSRLSLNESSISSLSIVQSHCAADLDARWIRTKANAYIAGQMLADVDFSRAVVDGSFGLGCDESYELGIQIGGTLYLDNTRAESVEIYGSEINGGISFQHALIKQSIAISGYLEDSRFRPLRVGADLGLDPEGPDKAGARPVGLNLYGTLVEHNYIIFRGIDVCGTVRGDFINVGTGLFIDSSGADIVNHIDGDLELGGAHMQKILRIDQLEVTGSVYARQIETQRLSFAVGHWRDHGTSTEQAGSRFPVKIGGSLSLVGAKFTGEVCMAGVDVGASGDGDGSAATSLDLHGAQIGGTLMFYVPSGDDRLRRQDGTFASTRGLSSRFDRGIKLSGTIVNGDIVLSHVDVRDGAINLRDSEINRDITLTRHDEQEPATAGALVLDGVECLGSIDLTGLELERSDADSGRILGRNLAVRKQLSLAKEGTSAIVPGEVDLSFSKLGVLEISCHQSGGINLGRTSIDMLTVQVHEQDYPRPISLLHADIRWWQFRHGETTSSDNADDYIQLLAGDEHKQIDTWWSVENGLQSRGMEHEADQIHKQMRRWLRSQRARSARQHRGFARGISTAKLWRQAVWDWLTDSQTNPARLIVVVIVWFMVSSMIFSLPENMGPTEEALAATVDTVGDDENPEDWGLFSGVAVALRHHFPVASFTAVDDWEPRTDTALTVWRDDKGHRWQARMFTPDGYANMVSALHWIILPIILLITSHKYLRRFQT
ncbi:MAG: hypothetical protein AAGF11_05490 [Myxococcota bacterium]